MAGLKSYGFHEGSRSEYLAQYVFASWGTAVIIPQQEDHGVDLACTLMDRVGSRFVAKSPYTVQVKSSLEPLVFESKEQVNWVIHHPLPLYLCIVEKKDARLSLYHTFPRFHAGALATLPPRLELVPEPYVPGEAGKGLGVVGCRYTLGPPILRFDVTEMLDDACWEKARAVFEKWVQAENENLTRIRAGLPHYRIPVGYRTNEWVNGWNELCLLHAQYHPGIMSHLRECLEWMGGQLHNREDVGGAARLAVLHRHLFANEMEGGSIGLIRGSLNTRLGLTGEGDAIARLGMAIDAVLTNAGLPSDPPPKSLASWSISLGPPAS